MWLSSLHFNSKDVEASKRLRTLPIAGLKTRWHPPSALRPQIPGQMFYAALRPTVPFLLRSAHLFFIISDKRFLPSGVSLLRRGLPTGRAPRPPDWLVTFSSAVIASSMRSRSRRSSSRMLRISKVGSFHTPRQAHSLLPLRRF